MALNNVCSGGHAKSVNLHIAEFNYHQYWYSYDCIDQSKGPNTIASHQGLSFRSLFDKAAQIFLRVTVTVAFDSFA
jgi:hypothetical protein